MKWKMLIFAFPHLTKKNGKNQHVDKEITIFQSQRHLFLLAELLTIDLTCFFGPSGQNETSRSSNK